ncbi:hypothetical protein HKO22_02235 [Peptoniphilus sp. AGMB00490]|uniref:Uncharacterized protein n=1 Tax=Peptoniphilus faecalis TaxID=2731255 RepID=A0A848RJR9_9FIRM|nr:hypothetical protein [Peptoniphilus faecalis]NMW84562.1 hypothetical protein [Peptoniphilus faecalis]
MRNNTRGLIFHILIIFITFAMAAIINISSSVRSLVYGNIFFKYILVAAILLLYYNFGKLLSKRNARSIDFFAGNLIFLIGLILFAFGFLGLGRKIFEASVGGSYWKFPLEFFLMPEVYAIKVLGINYNAISLLIATLIPSFIYGISIKISRAKIIKRNRLKNRRK